MGTNYYLMTKNKELVHSYFDTEYEIVDEPDFGYRIHLNKLSYGWKPLFQCHNKAYKTWNELEQFYYDYNSDFDIYDEYGTYYEFKEYKQEILDHAAREPEPVMWVYDFEPIELKFHPESALKRLHIRRCNPEEADLWIPFDHVRYKETEEAAREKYKVWDYIIFNDIKYCNDPDYPIDWVEGEFA